MIIISDLIQQTNQTSLNAKVNEDELKKAKPEKFKEGRPLSGEIRDLSQSGAKIILEDGTEITGKLLNAENAKIGQRVSFTVKTDDGKVFIELEPESLSESEQKFLSQVLKDNGLKNSPENLKMLKAMIENEMPLNRETVLKFNQAVKLCGKDGISKALFLMNNDLRLNPKNAETLDAFVAGDVKLSKQLSSLAALAEKIDEPELRDALLKILAKEAQANAPTKVNTQIDKAIANITHPKLRENLETQLKTIMNGIESLKPAEAKEKILLMLSKADASALPEKLREAAGLAEEAVNKTGEAAKAVKGGAADTAQVKELTQSLRSLANSAETLSRSSAGKIFLNGLKDLFTEAAKIETPRIEPPPPPLDAKLSAGSEKPPQPEAAVKSPTSKSESAVLPEATVPAATAPAVNAQTPAAAALSRSLANISHPKLRESLGAQLKTIMNSLETLPPAEGREKILSLLSSDATSLPRQLRAAADATETFVSAERLSGQSGKTQSDQSVSSKELVAARQLGESLRSLAQTAGPLSHTSGGKLFLSALRNVFAEAAKFETPKTETSELARTAVPPELPEESPKPESAPKALAPESEGGRKALKKLLLDFRNSEEKDINKFLNEVQEQLTRAKSVLLKSGAESSKPAEKLADDIKSNLSFMNQLNSPAYVQLPVLLNDRPLDMELYVFADRNKKKQNPNGILSALVAVDLDSIGHFESYIQKKGETVSFQFRLAQDNTEGLVRQNIGRLKALLQAVGCKLGSYSFKTLEQKFTLLDAEPEDMSEDAEDKDGEPKRITFDMRA